MNAEYNEVALKVSSTSKDFVHSTDYLSIRRLLGLYGISPFVHVDYIGYSRML